jgi:hypothetical protein
VQQARLHKKAAFFATSPFIENKSLIPTWTKDILGNSLLLTIGIQIANLNGIPLYVPGPLVTVGCSIQMMSC